MDGHALEVVVCDEVEGDYGGEQIYKDFQTSPHSRSAAFVLLADNAAGERMKRCLNAGMSEVVSKPFEVEELEARILKAIRQQRLRNQAHALDAGTETVGFRGVLEFLSLPDLLMNLHQNTRTGKLYLTVGDGDYIFSFRRGELLQITGPRGLKGRKALFRALRELSGDFRYVVADVPKKKSKSASDFSSLANIVLQAVQEADEFPLYRNKLPGDPVAVALSDAADDKQWDETTAIQPLLEGLLKSTTIDILIHACPKTDLQAAQELQELMDSDVVIISPTERP